LASKRRGETMGVLSPEKKGQRRNLCPGDGSAHGGSKAMGGQKLSQDAEGRACRKKKNDLTHECSNREKREIKQCRRETAGGWRKGS